MTEMKEAVDRLRQSLADFENDVDQAWDREDRPDLWEHVVEVPIADAKAILATLSQLSGERDFDVPSVADAPRESGVSGQQQSAIGFDDLRSANITRDKEWNVGSEKLSLSWRGNELAGEVGELCNVLKKLERERIGIVGSRATPEQLAEELADVIICTDLIAMDMGLDLGSAVARKFNATSEKVGLQTRLAAKAQSGNTNRASEASDVTNSNPLPKGE